MIRPNRRGLPGEDRLWFPPKVRKLRGLVYKITQQEGCAEWSADLSEQWIRAEEAELYYVDGHVQVYHGSLAELGKKHAVASGCVFRA